MKKMKQLAKSLKISKQVLFLGYVHNVHEILQCGNLCVSPSKREGLGLGVLEAIICGCPIIIADNRGHRDIVDNNKKYMFDMNDKKELTKKIHDAYNDPEKYRIEFPERYSLRSSLSEMRKIYEDLLK